MEFKYSPGKCDYSTLGSKRNLAEVTVELKDGQFSASGAIWNKRKTDYEICGQCLDEIVEYFPDDEILAEIITLWREWHLNYLMAGSPRQEAYLKSLDGTSAEPSRLNYFTGALEALKSVGLQPDAELIRNGKPYSYGSSWLTRELPEHVLAQIEVLHNKVKAKSNPNINRL